MTLREGANKNCSKEVQPPKDSMCNAKELIFMKLAGA